MKTRLLIIIGIIVALVSLTTILTMDFSDNKKTTVSDTSIGQLEAILEYCIDSKDLIDTVGLAYYNETHYIDTVTCEWQIHDGVEIDSEGLDSGWITGEDYCSEWCDQEELVSMGCDQPILAHLAKYSNLLDEEFDGTYSLDWMGLPNGMSKEKFDWCVDFIYEQRTFLSKPIVTDSLKIPNAERDAKLSEGCKLYPGGWECPDLSETANFDNITTMKPNSVEFFYYPGPGKDKDTHQLFMLIRLPEWMGGAENNTSAFRAYSAKALDDPCVVKYWPDVGRQRIENPCQGGMYRVIDGALTYGATHRSTAMTALPYLELSIDKNGMLYVEPPKFTPSENGVIGFGRNLSLDEIRNNSAFLIESFAKYYPKYPLIPTEFAGYILSEITPENHSTTVRYLAFPNKSGYITMTVGIQASGTTHPNFATPNVESWKIGDTEIRIGGSAMDEDSNTNESFRTYEIKFRDGYYYTIEGKNLEFLKKSMVASFFPEFEYGDLFLVSSTVKNEN